MKDFLVKIKPEYKTFYPKSSWVDKYGYLLNTSEDVIFQKSLPCNVKYFNFSSKEVNINHCDIWEFKLIKDCNIAINDIVVTNGDGSKAMPYFLEGMVGEITDKYFYVFSNDPNAMGSTGTIQPTEKGYLYSFKIKRTNTNAYMSIIQSKKARKDENGIRCYACKETYLKEDIKIIKLKKYCIDCCDKLFTTCTHCNKIVNKKKVVYGKKGLILCKECVENFYIKCNYCNDFVLKIKQKTLGNIKFCESCYKALVVPCKNCNRLHLKSDLRSGANNEGLFCNECWNERFNSCTLCGHVDWQDNLHFEETENRYFCNVCWQAYERRNYIRDYGYSPSNFSMNKNDWDVPLFLGIELEVQKKPSSSAEVLTLAKKLSEFLKKEKKEKLFYFKKDGSVDNGFEIVSHPFTLQYAHKKLHFQKMLNWMKENDFISEETGKCGLHVHASKEFYEDLDITKIRLFFSKNKDKIYTFSRRKGIGDEFCAYEKYDKTTVKYMLNGEYPSGRRYALNLNSSKDTIEFRLFRGTLNNLVFLASLQFVEAISNFVKVHGIASFIYGEGKYKNNSWELFIDWAKSENKYNHMLEHMRKEKICV